MHLKVKYIALYSFSTLGLLLMLNAYIASSPMYYGKANKIDKNYQLLFGASHSSQLDKGLTLVIGNSYVANSFQAEATALSALKFTVSGMLLVDILRIVENLPDETNVDSVLVGLGYDYANPRSGSSTVYDKHFASNRIKRLWSSIPLVRGHSLSSVIIQQDFKCIFSQRSLANCHSLGQNIDNLGSKETDIRLEDTGEHLKSLEDSTKQRYREYVPFVTTVSFSLEEYLLRLQDECRRRGIKLLAYTAPIYEELRALLDQSVLEEFRATIHNSGIEYVDMNLVFPDWDSSFYSDATHVEPTTGGILTTRHLAEHLYE